MAKVNVFFATGYEEVEALTVVDILRRAGVEVETVSVTGDYIVTSSHNVPVKMDKLIEETDNSAKMIVLPGGIPGVPNLLANEKMVNKINEYNADETKYLAAICAAPTAYGKLGILKGKKAICYPGMEGELLGAEVTYEKVVHDGRYITSRGLGTAIDFALTLVAILVDEKTANAVADKIVYKQERSYV